MKQIPYGIDDFERIITQDYYYIDKSQYIDIAEQQGSYLLFVRPRRMGKSLFVNMLMAYYDIAKKDQFESLFGSLWIGGHPTSEANKYLVLKFDFSHIKYEPEELEKNFTSYCMNRIALFLEYYAEYFTSIEREHILNQQNIKDSIVDLVARCRIKGLQTYLFIDEYDNFSNIVLSARGVSAHEAITHGEGFYRDFFKACKGTFHRVFMTGVAPVTYDDLTSGFNIGNVVALKPAFDKAIGVTETELREMIEYYRSSGHITRNTDEIVKEMKPWYDNFCFSEECFGVEPPIYNTDMVMRYIRDLILDGKAPQEMLDTNARTDFNKLNYLVLAEDLDNREQRIKIVKDICAAGYIAGHVKEQFPASRCGDEENFKSMLFYFGTLTFGGWDEYGEPKLVVPNKTMGELYLQYMLVLARQEGFSLTNDQLNDLQRRIKEAAVNHNWRPLIEKIGECYSSYSSLRNSIRGEADVQGFVRGLLCLNRFYDIWPELELGNGYCDVLLLPKGTLRCPTRFSYLIEIKYMKADESNVESRIAEACAQLDRYVQDKHLTNNPLLLGTQLTKIYLVFQGNALIAFGAID